MNEANDTYRNENFDLPGTAVYPKTHEKCLLNLSKSQEKHANFMKGDPSFENDARSASKAGDDVLVPQKAQNDNRNENLSPRGGKYYLRTKPKPNYSEENRY